MCASGLVHGEKGDVGIADCLNDVGRVLAALSRAHEAPGRCSAVRRCQLESEAA